MRAPDVGGQGRWIDSAGFVFSVAVLVAVLTRIIFPFDGLYGQDAYAYFRFARAIGPHLVRGAPLPFLYWPRGFPIATALFLPLVGGGPAAGQIVSTLSCAWAAAATFLMVRDLEPFAPVRRMGLSPATAAGLSVACSGAVLRTSQLVMSEGLALGLAATAMLCAVRYVTSRRGPWLVACAAAAAGGAVTRWLVGLLVLPLLIYLFFGLRQPPPGEQPSAATRGRSSWVWPLLATLVGLAVLSPQLWVTRDNPASIGNEWVVKWSLAIAVKREFHTAMSGYDRFRLPVGLYYFVRLGWPDYFFPTLALFAGAGLWLIVHERRRAQAALLLGWPLVVWLFLSGVPYENARFLLPTLPAIGVLVGLGYAALCRFGPVARTWIPAFVLILSLLAGLAPGANEHAHQVARKEAELSLIHWVVAEVPAQAELLMAGPTLAIEYYGGRPTHALYDLSEPDIDGLLRGQRPLFVLADVDNVEGQWKGLTPQLNLARLRASPGLSIVGQHPPYTLFAVHGTGR